MIEITGELKQNGTPSPDNPVEIENEIYIIKDGKKIKLERTDIIRLFEQELKVATEKEKTADELFEELGYIKDKKYSTDYKEKYKKDDDNIYYFDLLHKEYYKSGEWDGMCGNTTMQELKAINKKVEELRMELSKEEIEVLKEFKKTGFHTLGIKYNKNRVETTKMIERTIETVLNLISKLQKENEKQGKVIDEMTEHIVSSAIVDDMVCMYIDCTKEECHGDTARKCTKQYFYRKVERKCIMNLFVKQCLLLSEIKNMIKNN